MIKYLLFDLDDTLFNFHLSERQAIQKTLQHFGIDHSDEILMLYSKFNAEQWRLLERGETNRDSLKVKRFENFLNHLNSSIDAHEISVHYEEELGNTAILLDETIPLLNELYGKYKLYTVTNGLTDVQKRHIELSGLERYFERVFISEEINLQKPDKAFFDYVFDTIQEDELLENASGKDVLSKVPSNITSNNVTSPLESANTTFDKSKVIIIGDSLTSDVQGGINAGIKTVWYNLHHKKNDSTIEPNYEIKNIMELLPILDSLNNENE